MLKTSEQIADEVLEKTAFLGTLLGIIGGGLLSHGGTNALVRQAHNTRFLRNLREKAFAKGIQRGISGKPQSLGSKYRELWAGPETVAPEYTGQFLGGPLQSRSMGERYRALKKARKNMAMSPTISKAPFAEDVVGGINRLLTDERKAAKLPFFRQPGMEKEVFRSPGRLPHAGIPQQESMLKKVLTYAPVPAAIAGGVAGGPILGHLPAALIHGGVNRTRLAVAKSKGGQDFMRNAFFNALGEAGAGSVPLGIRRATAETKIPWSTTKALEEEAQLRAKQWREQSTNPEASVMHDAIAKIVDPTMLPSPPRGAKSNLTWDLAVSPAALSTERAGRTIGDVLHAPGGEQELKRLLSSLHTMIGNPRIIQTMRASGYKAGPPPPELLLDLLMAPRQVF